MSLLHLLKLTVVSLSFFGPITGGALALAPSVTPEYRQLNTGCNTSKDCDRGFICAVESVACPSNPQASECVRKVCAPIPNMTAVKTVAFLTTGPDDSEALRIHASLAGPNQKSVWVQLHGATWQAALRGSKRLDTVVHSCANFGAPLEDCRVHNGTVILDTAVSPKIGQKIRGAIRFVDLNTGQPHDIPFAGLITGNPRQQRGRGL